MDFVEFQWLAEETPLKEALKETLGSSGQLLKKHFSSKDLQRPVRERDILRIPLDVCNHLRINPVYQGPELPILFENDDFLGIHKAPGIHSHPQRYSDTNTVLNFLAATGKWEALSLNESDYDRGLLYRLDFETSGVLLLAKKAGVLESFRKDFHTLMKRKFYWAIVEGQFNQDGEWGHHFKPSGEKGSKQKVSEWPVDGSTEGILSVKKILEKDHKSLVLVQLHSGLRHQIRAQLAHLGFPILGDELYGGQKAERLFLHALRYEWGEAVEDVQAELFDRFFDLDRALQVSHDVFGSLKGL